MSIACYLTAVDRCYVRLCRKIDKLRQQSSNGASRRDHQSFSLADVDYCVMHVGALLGFTIALHGSLIADRVNAHTLASCHLNGFFLLCVKIQSYITFHSRNGCYCTQTRLSVFISLRRTLPYLPGRLLQKA